MSSQSAKKKRLGSRRQAPAQNAKPEGGDVHVAEGSSLTQSCEPEGNTETFNALSNLIESPSETSNPTSRRKMGSSRRSKRTQHSTAADLHHREEVEEKTSNDEALQTTQLLEAMQPQKQEDLSHRNEPSVPVMHDSSLYSSDGCFSEPTAVKSPEAAPHVLQSEQLKENAHRADGLSVLSSPSLEVQFTNQSNPTMPEEPPKVFLADKEECELLRHDGRLQNLGSESHLKPKVTEFLSTSGTQTLSTHERSPEVNIRLEYCDEKEVFSSRLKEFTQSEEKSEHLSFQVYDTHYPSEDAATNAHKQEDNLTQMEEVNNSCESVTHGTTENSEMLRNLVDGAEASDSFECVSKQEDYITKDSALCQINEVGDYEEDDTTLNAEQMVDQQSEGILTDSEVTNNSLQILISESQESDTYLNPTVSEIESSRTYKERPHAQESVAETSHTSVEDVENTRETMLEKLSTAEEIQFDQFEEDTNVQTHVGIPEFTTLSSLSTSPVEQHLVEGSNPREMGGNKLPHMNPVKDTERDEDVESIRHGGNLQDDYLEAALHVTLEDMAESLITPEVSTEKSKPEPECKAGQMMMPLLTEQKQNENPTEESNSQTSECATEDYHVSDTKKVQITGLESAATVLSPVYEIEFQVQDDKIISGEQTALQENESILTVLESNDCSSETQPSEVQPLSDSQPQQDDPNFHPTISRRKLGSSRRHKGRQYLKECVTESASEGKEEIVESTESDEALPATHGSSLYSEVMQSYSPEDYKPTELNNPEPNLGVVVPESENVQQTQDEKGFEAEVSGETDKAMVEEIDKSDTLQPEEMSSESAHHSEDALSEMPDQEVDSTKMHEGNNSFENETHDAMGQVDWTILDATPSELTEKNMADPAIKKEDLNSDDKNDVLLTERSSHVALDQKNKDYFGSVTKEVQITGLESAGTALSPVYETEVQAQDDKIISGDQALPVTHGSSLYSEVMQSYSPEDYKPTELSNPEPNLGVLVPESENLQQTPDDKHSDFGVEVSGKTEEAMVVEIDSSDTLQSEDISSESAHHSEDALNEMLCQEVDSTKPYKGSDSFENVTHVVIGQVELTAKNSEGSAPKQENVHFDDRNDVHLITESNPETLYQKNEHLLAAVTKEFKIRETEGVDTALNQLYTVEGLVKDDVNLSTEQTAQQEKEKILSELEECESSVHTIIQSETNAISDFQSLDNPVSTEEIIQTDFNPTGNGRKLGSSRRIKRRQHADDSASESRPGPKEEVVENTMDNELKTPNTFSTNKTVVLGKSVKMEIWVDEMALADPNAAEFPEQAIHVGIPEWTTSNLLSTTDQLQLDGSNSSKISKVEVPCMTSEVENENLDNTFLVTELHVGSEDVKASVKLEASTESHSPGESKDPECSIEQATLSTTEQEIGFSVTSDISTGKHSTDKHRDTELSVEQAAGSAPGQQQEYANPDEVEMSPHSEDVLNIVSEDTMKPTQVVEYDQTEPSSFKERGVPLATPQSDVAASLDLYPQDSSVGIEQPNQISFSTIGNRRKLGSSRRNKARQCVRDTNDVPHTEPRDEVVATAMKDISFNTTKISLVMETARQEELIKQTELDPNRTQEQRIIQSTVNDKEIKDKLPDEDTILSQKVMDESEVMPTDINSSLGKDDAVKSNKATNEGAIKLIKEPKNVTRPDTVEFESLQSQDDSEVQSMSYRDGDVSTISVTVDVLEQGDANQIQQTEVVSYDKDSVEEEMTVQLPNNVADTARDTTVTDCRSEVESSTDAQVGENLEKKDKEAQEMNISQEVTTAGPFSTAQDKNDASIPSLQEQSGIPITSSNLEEIRGQIGHENVQRYSKQKKRKMGSTRRSQLKARGEQEEALSSQAVVTERDFTLEADVQKVDKLEMVEESPKTTAVSWDLNPKKTPADEGQQPQSSTSELRSSLVSAKDAGTAVLSGHSVCHNKDVGNNDTPEGSFMSLCESSQSTPKEGGRQESENVIQEQALKSTETPNLAAADLKIVKSEIRGATGEENADVQAGMQEPNAQKSLEMKNRSPKLNSANPRRKMGSTRRNLTSRDKKEDLQQEQDVDSEANVGDIKAETPGTEGDPQQTQQKVFETVESSYTGESYLKPPSVHSFEESPVSHDQLVETEPPVPSIIPSTSPKHEAVTETAPGGRRRKLGSHRRSRRSPGNENQTANGDRTTEMPGVVHEIGIKTTDGEPLGLDRVPVTDESSLQPTSIISTPTAAAHLKAEGTKSPVKVSPVKQTSANIRLGQDSQQAFSLGAAPGSSSYNVLMIGDSSVGKTSFMRRAQSGKFAVDLPASVGLDSCRWTVVVDGKPVVLQVWDTAGQERFHSITRQVFHRAQAFILMYDITSSQSFSAISYWADCIQEGAAENVTILLVGNKSDRAERQVKAHEGENIAKEYNFEFMECSAATGENVIECLETVARMLSQRVDTRVDSTVLHKEPQQKKSSGCC